MSRVLIVMDTKKNELGSSDMSKELLRHYRGLCKSARKSILKKLIKRRNEYEIASKWLWDQQIGDSLLAAVTNIPKGVKEWNLLNVHSQKQEKVKLNPKLDASRNAQIFYRKAKKGKRGVEICKKQLRSTEDELAQIEILLQRYNDCLLLDESTDEFKKAFNDIQADFWEKNFIAELSINKHSREIIPKVPYKHFTVDEWDVYIGKSNAQNDELSIKFAKPWDLWFHVAVHAGSHVIIKRQKNADWPPKPVIEKVAALSVWFSKARHTSYAEVNVCEARYVSKPKKSPPGEVVIKQYKSVRVSPKSPQELFRS